MQGRGNVRRVIEHHLEHRHTAEDVQLGNVVGKLHFRVLRKRSTAKFPPQISRRWNCSARHCTSLPEPPTADRMLPGSLLEVVTFYSLCVVTRPAMIGKGYAKVLK